MLFRSVSARTIGAIALGLANDRAGYHQFLNLSTGKVISRRQYHVLPMTEEVIKRVEQLAKAENQPIKKYGCPEFERDTNGNIYEYPKDEDDGNFSMSEDELSTVDSDELEQEVVDPQIDAENVDIDESEDLDEQQQDQLVLDMFEVDKTLPRLNDDKDELFKHLVPK